MANIEIALNWVHIYIFLSVANGSVYAPNQHGTVRCDGLCVTVDWPRCPMPDGRMRFNPISINSKEISFDGNHFALTSTIHLNFRSNTKTIKKMFFHIFAPHHFSCAFQESARKLMNKVHGQEVAYINH